MEANPQIGDRYYQEFAPAVVEHPATVLDQGEVFARDEMITVPAGTFTNVLRTEDTTVVEPDALANKFFAPGLGTIQELDFDYLTGEVSQITRLISAELDGQLVTEVVSPIGFAGTNVTGPVTKGILFDGTANIRAGESVIVRGVEFEEERRISSRTDIAVIESLFDDSAWLRADEAVNLQEVLAEETVKIRGDGDVYIFESELQGLTDIRLGAGDNTVVAEDSEFHRLVADGGRRKYV